MCCHDWFLAELKTWAQLKLLTGTPTFVIATWTWASYSILAGIWEWVLENDRPKRPRQSCMTFYDLALRAIDYHFHDLLLLGVAVKIQIQGWGHRLNLLMERSVKNFVIFLIDYIYITISNIFSLSGFPLIQSYIFPLNIKFPEYCLTVAISIFFTTDSAITPSNLPLVNITILNSSLKVTCVFLITKNNLQLSL